MENIVVSVDGSARNYTLRGVAENSVYSMSLLARNVEGSSEPTAGTITTIAAAGMILYFILIGHTP